MEQPPAHWNFENVPPTTTRSHDEGGSSSQKRKRDQAMNTYEHDRQARTEEAHAFQSTNPRHYPPPDARTHNAMPGEPQVYVPPAGMYMPQERQTSMPRLPGAEEYQRRQLDRHISSPSQNNSHAVNTSRAREHTKPEPSVAASSLSDQLPRRTEPLVEQRMSRNRYPPPPGSQHNPVDLASSPELDLRVLPKRRNKKNNFYAVAAGHVPGVYQTWAEAERQVKGYSGAKHRGFATMSEAELWLGEIWGQSDRIRDSAVKSETPTRTYQNVHPIQPVFSAQDASHARLPSPRLHETAGPSWDNLQTHYEAADFIPLSLTKESADAPRTIDTSDPDPVLKPEQQKVVDLILEGHNVFYTGSAGCGKSTILKAFVKQLQLRGKSVKIVAPTNLAALNVGGCTTWSFAGWTPDSMKKSIDKLMANSHGNEVWERFDKTDVLVIDEISMVENLLFERLNYIMKASIGEKNGGGAFGGVQIIVTGDVSPFARR
jgi:hypothetical protein